MNEFGALLVERAISDLTALGNFSSVLVAMVLPPILHNVLMGKVLKKGVVMGNWIFAGVSSIVMVVCTVVSFISLIGKLKQQFA